MRRLCQLPDKQVNPPPPQRTKHAPCPYPLHQAQLCNAPGKEDTKASDTLNAEGNERGNSDLELKQPWGAGKWVIALLKSAPDSSKNSVTRLWEQITVWEAGLRLSSGETSHKTLQPWGAEHTALKLPACVARIPASGRQQRDPCCIVKCKYD